MSNEIFPEIFVDELAGILLGYPTSKLTFVAARQVGTSGAIEKAKVLTLSISTQNLLNACNMVLDHAKENQALIINGASESTEKLLASLHRVAVDTPEKTASVPQKKTKVVKAIKSE